MICPPDRISSILNTSEIHHAARFLDANCISWLAVTSPASFGHSPAARPGCGEVAVELFCPSLLRPRCAGFGYQGEVRRPRATVTLLSTMPTLCSAQDRAGGR